MKLERIGLAISLVVGLALAASPAFACGCPKEAMLKLNGTVSMVPPEASQQPNSSNVINLLPVIPTATPAQPSSPPAAPAPPLQQ